jgi:hypothetical protein
MRDELMRLIGMKCRHCGSTKRKKLEFDHKVRRTWRSADVTWHRRLKRYFEDWRAGHLGVACRSCNARFRPPAPRMTPAEWAEVW